MARPNKDTIVDWLIEDYPQRFSITQWVGGAWVETITEVTFTVVATAAVTSRRTITKGITIVSTPVMSVSRSITKGFTVVATGTMSIGTVVSRFMQALLKHLETNVRLRVVGPQVAKAGTVIEIETTFTNAEGTLFDPTSNLAYIQVKKPDGTTYTGYAFANNVTMTRQSTGVYRHSFQTAIGDAAGTWTFEVKGPSGAYTALSDMKIQVKT